MPDDSLKTTMAADVVVLPATRERLIDGMCGIVRRMTRISPAGILCLCDYDERELAIALLSYLDGVRHYA